MHPAFKFNIVLLLLFQLLSFSVRHWAVPWRSIYMRKRRMCGYSVEMWRRKRLFRWLRWTRLPKQSNLWKWEL